MASRKCIMILLSCFVILSSCYVQPSPAASTVGTSACDSWLSRASLDHLAQPSRPVCPRAWTAAGSYGWTGEALLRVFGADARAEACISVLARLLVLAAAVLAL